MAMQYRLQKEEPERTQFIAFDQAYHGDTLGAASLGGVSAFFKCFQNFGFSACHLKSVEDLLNLDDDQIDKTAAVIIEPLVQGVNQIRPWPEGMLRGIRQWCDMNGVHLILDEVMTGFGRTGTMFACQQEEVIPDFLCLAKGLTGGYMPLAATMVKESIYQAFLGDADRAFYYGHSYTANQLGCASALANLDLFEQEKTLELLPEKAALLRSLLSLIAEKYDLVYEVRQCGLIAGVELRQSCGRVFDSSLRVGEKICLMAREHSLLTRPIRDTIVIMPPLSISLDEMKVMCASLDATLSDWLKNEN